jgi:hypothetical protein
VAGTSHIAISTGCQDSCIACVETDMAKPPLLTIFVADGAGSASHGGTGAELAVEAATTFANERYALSELPLDNLWAEACIKAVRSKICEAAETNGAKTRDYACTFLGVVSSPSETLIMQVGDGGIVVDIGNGLEVPIAPMTGEYANMTNFVTDEDAIEILAVKALPARADRVAVFSDGIQRLALNMATNTAHAPFFAPFFTVLATAQEAQEDYLHSQLIEFLESQAVNERTDDDKTLAFAHWIE